jgi:hypothetical protein
MTRLYDPKTCENPKCQAWKGEEPKVFRPTRRWQRFCSERCRHQFHESGLIYVPVARRRKGRSHASENALSARRPSHALCYRVRGKFAFSPAPGARPVLRVREDGVVVWFRLIPKPQMARMTRIKEALPVSRVPNPVSRPLEVAA